MPHIGLLVFAVFLCAVSAQEVSVTGTDIGSSTVLENESTTEATPINKKFMDEICFDRLGCFSLLPPWKTPLRPIPAPLDPDIIPVYLLFYSRGTAEVKILTYPNVDLQGAPFDPRKPTAIITHGYSNNGSAQWLHDLKDAYLRKIDANVMITDWGAGAQKYNYLQVTGNTRVVGKLVANTLKYLIQNHGADKKKIHLIGHSLGAQISSYIAKEIPGIARLTALDPAQPGFETFDKAVRLDKSDADFVDVIHTDAKPFIPTFGFGMMAPHGHVDFYMNGGFQQPGCIIPDTGELPKVASLLDLLKFPVEYISEIKSCNHGRAHRYLIEAFNETEDCIFWGHKANAENIARSVTHTLTQGILKEYVALSPVCSKDDCAPLGFETQQSPLRGTFLITTSNREPYCIPEDGIQNEKKPNGAGTILDGASHFIGNIGKEIMSLFSPKQ